MDGYDGFTHSPSTGSVLTARQAEDKVNMAMIANSIFFIGVWFC